MCIIPAVNTSAELDPTISVSKQIRTNLVLIFISMQLSQHKNRTIFSTYYNITIPLNMGTTKHDTNNTITYKELN